MKRVVALFACLMVSFGFLFLRLYVLATDQSMQSGASGGSVTIRAASSRGNVYDRKGQRFVNETAVKIAVVPPMEQAPMLLLPVAARKDFDTAYTRLSSGKPAAIPVTEDIYAEGIRMVHAPVRYGEEVLIPHLLGYCNGAGEGVCGLERGFADLLGERTCSVTFPVNARGRVLCGMGSTLQDEGILSPAGVELTLDKDFQRIVRDAMLKSGFRKGAAVMLDVQTGDILAMVSVPEFDVRNPGADLQNADAPFVNRAFNAVSVGSVYKMIVAAAMLENGVSPQFRYTCTGATEQDGILFHCHNHAGHGELTMQEALANSCNPWFINAARQIPVDAILTMSWRLGLGSGVELCEGIPSAPGILPEESELVADSARANIAFGQGRLTATPLQIAAATAAIVNGGVYHEPRLIQATVDEDGQHHNRELSTGQQVLSAETAEQVRRMLVYTAEQSERLAGVDCGGKTATAQTGIYKGETEQLNTWFSGFFPASQPQYVLTILCEDGISGAKDCIPVFEQIFRKIMQ